MGFPGAYSHHVADGQRHDYIQVSGSGPVAEGERYPAYDTPEEAVAVWRNAVKEFEGKNYLYWRVKPEIDHDEQKRSFDGSPNPTFGKWKVYSRFRALD